MWALQSLKRLPDIRQVLFDWDVVHPRVKLWVKEFLPLLPNMENQRATQKEVLQPEAGCHATEIKQISAEQRLRSPTVFVYIHLLAVFLLARAVSQCSINNFHTFYLHTAEHYGFLIQRSGLSLKKKFNEDLYWKRAFSCGLNPWTGNQPLHSHLYLNNLINPIPSYTNCHSFM